MTDIVASNVISHENFVKGLTEILDIAPDLYIDIPMLYENLGKFISPQIEKKVCCNMATIFYYIFFIISDKENVNKFFMSTNDQHFQNNVVHVPCAFYSLTYL